MSRRPSRRRGEGAQSSAGSPHSISPAEVVRETGKGWLTAAIVVALCACVGLLYAPATRFEFLEYDDQDYVWQNLEVRSGLSGQGLRWAISTDHCGNRHPLTWLSHQLDVELFGPDESGCHHLTSIVLHALNAVLVFVLFQQLTARTWASALIAALFAVHPLAVEATAWVAERKTVLALCLGLLSLLCYARYVRNGRWSMYVGSLLFLTLGLMAKQTLVTWPFLMLLLDFWPFRRWLQPDGRSAMPISAWQPARPLLIEKLPHFSLIVVACLVVLQVQQAAKAAWTELPLGNRLANAVVSYVMYLRQAFWPTDLAVLYPHPRGTLAPMLVAGCLALLAMLTAGAFACRRRWPFATVGWLWFVGTLVPVSGVVQVGMQARADRYAYGPLIGVYLIVAFAAAEAVVRWPRLRTAVIGTFLTALVVLAIVTSRQLSYWHDTGALFAHALEVNDDNWIAHVHVARDLRKRGDLPSAVEHFRAAERIAPDRADVLVQLGQALVENGQVNEAHVVLDRALQSEPANAAAHFWRGKACLAQSRLNEAAVAFRAAADHGLRTVNTLFNLGIILLELGRRQEGVEALEQALLLAPDDQQIRTILSEAYCRLADGAPVGEGAAKLRWLRRARELDPNNHQATAELAWFLATTSETELRNAGEALTLAEPLPALWTDEPGRTLDILAAAQAASGRYVEATQTAKRGAALARMAGQAELAEAIAARAALYERGRAYVETGGVG